MSIRWSALVTALGMGSPAMAQDPSSMTAEQVLKAAAETYAVPPPPAPRRTDCDNPVGNEIVVCAPLANAEALRVRSRLDDGDDSHLSWQGDPPSFAAPPCVPNLLTACSKAGAPPPPAYLFDITALPPPPPGSDADLIARGLRPAR